VVSGQTTITLADGTTKQAYDLGLAYVEPVSNHSNEMDMVPHNDGLVIPASEMQQEEIQPDQTNIGLDIS
jgi:hypothetical protein